MWLQRSVLTQWRCLAFMLSAPFLFPPVAQESDRGSGLAGSRSYSLSPGWIFSSPQIPSAIGYWLLPLPLFLAAPANWNLISWAPALACFCQLDQRTNPPGQDRLDTVNPTRATQDLCSGSHFKLVVLHGVAVLIVRGISMLNLDCFPTQWELVTYPLLEVWSSPGEDKHCSSFRIIGTWNRLLLHHNTLPPCVLSGHPSSSLAPLSCGVSVWLLCTEAFWSCILTNLDCSCLQLNKCGFRSVGRQIKVFFSLQKQHRT